MILFKLVFRITLVVIITFVCSCNNNQQTKLSNQIDNPDEINSLENVNNLLQSVIDNDKLKCFYHLNEPGRNILYVSGNDIPKDAELFINGDSIRIINDPTIVENCLVINAIIEKDSVVEISVSYPIEGVKGEFLFKYIEDKWNLDTSDVIEL